MASRGVNKVIILGRVGQDPEVRYSPSGTAFAIEAENINDCYDHWMIWAQIAHADVTNIRIEELKEHQAA